MFLPKRVSAQSQLGPGLVSISKAPHDTCLKKSLFTLGEYHKCPGGCSDDSSINIPFPLSVVMEIYSTGGAALLEMVGSFLPGSNP